MATVTTSPAAELRWRKAFRGVPESLSEVRRWLRSMLPACPARDDVIETATELGTNAVKFTGSGRGGWFAVEITWSGPVVRIAVADGGAATEPRVIDDPLAEHGRGLLMVRELSARMGVCGDRRGRLVWAEIAWSEEGAAGPAVFPAGCEPAIRADEAALAERFAGVPVWFGRSTLQWWAALPGRAAGQLLTAPSAPELASLLDKARRQPAPPRQIMAQDPGAARAEAQAKAPMPPVPPRIHRPRPRRARLNTQPC